MSVLIVTFLVLLLAAVVIGISLGVAFSVRQRITNRREQYISSFPVATSSAYVVDKRSEVRGSSSQYGGSTSTSYFATFEFSNGERVELALTGEQSGQLIIGDTGTLTWQGRVFRSFQRELMR